MRPRIAAGVAIGAALVLATFLFGPWYRVDYAISTLTAGKQAQATAGFEDVSAWNAFALRDAALAALAAVALLATVATLASRPGWANLAALCGLIAAILVATAIVWPPHRIEVASFTGGSLSEEVSVRWAAFAALSAALIVATAAGAAASGRPPVRGDHRRRDDDDDGP